MKGLDMLTPGGENELEPQIADSKPNPESSYAEQEKTQILSSAIARLEPKLRAAIQLYHLEDRSLEESAEISGVTVTAMKARVFRGRIKLRQSLRPFLTSTSGSGRPSSRRCTHAGSQASAARPGETKPKGGRHVDDFLRQRVGGLGVAVPLNSRRREWVGPGSLNRVRKPTGSARAEAKHKE
jgi:predicted HTH domain antitoxin